MEDTVQEMTITVGEDSDDGSDDSDSDMIDDDGRQLIDKALQQLTSTEATSTTAATANVICTNPRRELTTAFQNYDPQCTATFMISYFQVFSTFVILCLFACVLALSWQCCVWFMVYQDKNTNT